MTPSQRLNSVGAALQETCPGIWHVRREGRVLAAIFEWHGKWRYTVEPLSKGDVARFEGAVEAVVASIVSRGSPKHPG